MAKLSKLPKIVGKKKKRRGRGRGSGKGFHTTGSGMKGQKSRAGHKQRLWFEGGQTPLTRALPKKKGFKPLKSKQVIGINLDLLEKSGLKSVTQETLRKHYGIKAKFGVKILGRGEIKRKVSVKGVPMSKTAKDRIEKAGGKVTTINKARN